MKASKILGVILTVVAGLLLTGKVQALQLRNTSVVLSDQTPSAPSSFTFNTKISTGDTIHAIKVEFCKTPSGACVYPTNLDLSDTGTVVLNDSFTGLVVGDWTATVTGGNLNVLEFHSVTGAAKNADDVIEFGIKATGNHNPHIGDCNSAANASADTCYVRITTYSDNLATKIDEALASFTIVSAVTVTARVDPTFSFVVTAVPASDTHAGITTSVPSTFATLPFGNLTANTPSYAAHQLNVTTNTQGGYTVTAVMQHQMTGVFSDDNIDPFVAPWTGPTTWTQPTGGTPNDNTAWFGANTTDIRVANWGTPNGLFGGVGSVTPVQVMKKTNSDDGTLGIYVTYAIEANVFQPADSYTGILVYNALPTY